MGKIKKLVPPAQIFPQESPFRVQVPKITGVQVSKISQIVGSIRGPKPYCLGTWTLRLLESPLSIREARLDSF